MRKTKRLEKEISGLNGVVSRYRSFLDNVYYHLKKKSKEDDAEFITSYEKELLDYLEQDLGFPDDAKAKENSFKKIFLE